MGKLNELYLFQRYPQEINASPVPTHLGPGQFLLNGGIAGLHMARKLKVVYGVFMATVDFLKKKPTQGHVMS